MFCPNCGTQNEDRYAFCKQCGSKLTSVPATPAPAPAPSPAPFAGQSHAAGQPHPVWNAVKEIASSPLFLTAIIAFSLSLLLQAVQMFRFPGDFLSRVGEIARFAEIDYDEIAPLMSFSQGAFSAFAVIALIPSVLVAVGLWMTYVSAQDRENPGMKTAGLTMIKVIHVIQLVFISITLAFTGILFLFLDLLIAGRLGFSSDISDILPYGFLSLSVFFLVIVEVICFTVLILVLLYYAKIIRSINTVKRTLQSGVPSDKVSGFVAVIAYILAGFQALSALSSLAMGNLFGTGVALSSATSMICFGILIYRYKNAMRTQMASFPGQIGIR